MVDILSNWCMVCGSTSEYCGLIPHEINGETYQFPYLHKARLMKLKISDPSAVEGVTEHPLPGPESDVEPPEAPSAGDEPDQAEGDRPEALQPLQSCWCYHRCDHG